MDAPAAQSSVEHALRRRAHLARARRRRRGVEAPAVGRARGDARGVRIGHVRRGRTCPARGDDEHERHGARGAREGEHPLQLSAPGTPLAAGWAMNGSGHGVRLGRIFGIEITFDYSWLFIVFLLTWSLASTFAHLHPDWTSVASLAIALLAAL